MASFKKPKTDICEHNCHWRREKEWNERFRQLPNQKKKIHLAMSYSLASIAVLDAAHRKRKCEGRERRREGGFEKFNLAPA
jgi:hypothetical protein